MPRPDASKESAEQAVGRMGLSHTHGARAFFTFIHHGPPKVRSFVEALGLMVAYPHPDNDVEMSQWLHGMNTLFGGLPVNKGPVETVGWITRRCISLGLQRQVLAIAQQTGGFAEDVQGILEREGNVQIVKPQPRQSGMTAPNNIAGRPMPNPGSQAPQQQPLGPRQRSPKKP